MARHDPGWEKAITGLEMVIILVIIIGMAILSLHFLQGGGVPEWGRTFPGGMVAESRYISGDSIQPVGKVYGFPSASGTAGGTAVVFSNPDPGSLGAVKVTLSLFIGDTGAIDMDRLTVIWNSGADAELLGQTISSPVICPNWTISGKYNMLPGRTADSDNLLEPGEQFEVLVCPSNGVLPYGTFTLNLIPDGTAVPLRLTRTVPAKIQPVMDLGW
jgi:hypothetical protein